MPALDHFVLYHTWIPQRMGKQALVDGFAYQLVLS